MESYVREFSSSNCAIDRNPGPAMCSPSHSLYLPRVMQWEWFAGERLHNMQSATGCLYTHKRRRILL